MFLQHSNISGLGLKKIFLHYKNIVEGHIEPDNAFGISVNFELVVGCKGLQAVRARAFV